MAPSTIRPAAPAPPDRKLVGQWLSRDELTPIKGQLTILLPQPEIDYVVLDGLRYMFPRQDGILLGGTFERGVWELQPNKQAARRILAAHMELFRMEQGSTFE